MKTIIEMANETLEKMAPDAHCREPYWTATNEELERFAELVRADAIADEREACAKVCEETEKIKRWDDYIDGCQDCAAAIRARGNT